MRNEQCVVGNLQHVLETACMHACNMLCHISTLRGEGVRLTEVWRSHRPPTLCPALSAGWTSPHISCNIQRRWFNVWIAGNITSHVLSSSCFTYALWPSLFSVCVDDLSLINPLFYRLRRKFGDFRRQSVFTGLSKCYVRKLKPVAALVWEELCKVRYLWLQLTSQGCAKDTLRNICT